VLLYNAAQSYRLAGNKRRALELYQTYVRLYPDGANAAEAGTQATALKKAVEAEPPPAPTASAAAAASPAPAAAPPPVEPVSDGAPTPAPPPVAPPPTAGARNNPAVPLVSRPAPRAEEKRSITQKTWFWVAVGAGVIVATTLILVSARDTKYPDPTYGTARGN